ncbi:hypothetical protein [Treponema sp. R6D11]
MDAVRLPAHGALYKNNYIVLRPTNQKDLESVLAFFKTKAKREEYNNKEYFVQTFLTLPQQHRTHKQLKSVFALVTAIFESMEGRTPLDDEKTKLYYDLLDLYADKVPNRFNKELRPVHISEANSIQGSRFIDGLLQHLATECELDYGTMATVQSVLEDWEDWKGRQEYDPSDYRDVNCQEMLTHDEWIKTHPYSEASGRSGRIVRAHIVSRGSDAADIEKSWNWLALLWDEHEKQHRIGWDAFLQIYPHLKGRVDRARTLAGKLELDYRTERLAIEYKPDNLAEKALEEI